MAARGATVILIARNGAALADVARELEGNVDTYACDVGDLQAVTGMAKYVVEHHGTPDVIVNNAGAGQWHFIEDTDPEEILPLLAAPAIGAMYVTRAFITEMIERGSGRIVNVNSPVSELPWPGAVGYGTSRWALRGFDAMLASDLRGTGVGVTAVIPGKVSSSYFENNPGAEERVPNIAKLMPTLTPDQVATMIVRGVERNERRVVEPTILRLLLLQNRILPTLTEPIMWLTGTRRALDDPATKKAAAS
jgi:short-subunit dehydrogenase